MIRLLTKFRVRTASRSTARHAAPPHPHPILLLGLLALLLAARLWADAWRPITPATVPPARVAHTLTDVGGRIFLYGGVDTSLPERGVFPRPGEFSDLWAFDSGSNEFHQIVPSTPSPPVRHSHAAAALDSKLYMYGGKTGETYLSDLWRYDPQTNAWTQVPTSGPGPGAVAGPRMVAIANFLYVYGGLLPPNLLADASVFRVNPAMGMWERRASNPINGQRFGHTAVVLNNLMYVFGGTDGQRVFNDLHVYDPAQDRWSPVTPAGTVPPPRFNMAAVEYFQPRFDHAFAPLSSTENADPSTFLTFGGRGISVVFRGTWQFRATATDLGVWEQRTNMPDAVVQPAASLIPSSPDAAARPAGLQALLAGGPPRGGADAAGRFGRSVRQSARRVLLFGGFRKGVATNTTLLYFPDGPPSTSFAQRVDLNNDGRGDVFRYHPTSGTWAREVENGSLDARVLVPTASAWSPNWVVKAADWNADGFTDFFLYNATTGQWFKAINNQATDFTYVGGMFSPGWRPYIVDLDGNGRSDAFLYNVATGVWASCVSTGAGTGDFSCVVNTWSSGWTLVPLDLNGDGRDDFVLYNGAIGQAFRATNDGVNNFTYANEPWSAGWVLHVGKFNADSLRDLWIYNPTTGQYFFVYNTGAGWTYAAGTFSPGWTARVGDFNGDGLDDLLVHNATTGQWVECFNTGASGFTFASGSFSPGWTVFVTDFNGDGRADLLLYNAATGAAAQAINTANGTFTVFNANWGTGFTVLANRRDPDY